MEYMGVYKVTSAVSEGSRGCAPTKRRKALGFLSKSGPDSLKNHKATKPEFNVEQSSARKRTPFKWRFAGVPMMARF